MNFAERHRSSWTHTDSPECDIAQLAHDLLGVVGGTDGNTARGDDGIGVFAGGAESGFQLCRIILMTPMSMMSQPRRLSMPYKV
jgi:hypothetical protein